MTPPEFLMRVPPLKLHVRNATQSSGDPAVFEVFCRLNKAWGTHDEPADVVQWSLWKTYEEFQAFDNQMRAVRKSPFAKMMVTVAFAPGHRVRAFFHQDHTSAFLEKRRAELDFYMQRVMLFPDVADFLKGRSCKVLADFIGASQYMDCSGVLSSSRSTSEDYSSSCGIPRSSMDSTNRASVMSFVDAGDPVSLRRKMYRVEIEEEVASRGGTHELKRFKKHARAFRKENDPVAAAKLFVEFLQNEYEPEFALWILQLFARSTKSTEKREALCGVGRISAASVDAEAISKNEQRQNVPPCLEKEVGVAKKYAEQELQSFASVQKPADDPVIPARISRKKTNRQILERVNALSNANVETVGEFKQAAKALGNQEMTGQAFVEYLRTTFGNKEAEKLLLLVVESVPQPQVQQELRVALAR